MKLVVLFLSLSFPIVFSEECKPNEDPQCKPIISTFAYNKPNAYMTWDNVNPCFTNPTYKVSYKIGDGEPEIIPAINNSNIAIIPLETLTCEKVFAKLLVSESDDPCPIESEEIEMERELDEVKNLTARQEAHGLFVQWESLNLGENCRETYDVTYKMGNNEDSIIPNLVETHFTTINVTEDDLCTKIDITVEAKVNGFKSKPAQLKFELRVPPVEDITLTNQDGQINVDFKRNRDPNILEKCGDFDYRVTYKDLGCFNTSFMVIPYSTTGTPGAESVKTIVREPGEVRNPTVTTQGEEIILAWTPPIGAEECKNIYYFIEFDNGVTGSTGLTYFKKTDLKLESCGKVTIAKIIPGVLDKGQLAVKGTPLEVKMIGEMGTVENLSCSLKRKTTQEVRCEWKKPVLTDNCEKITYTINYYDGTGVYTEEIEDTFFEFQITTKMCLVAFRIEPKGYLGLQEYPGKSTEATLEDCRKFFTKFFSRLKLY